MATLTNEQREDAAIAAAKAISARSLDPMPYVALVAPYPVWAAIFACDIARAHDEYKDVATGLFQDDYETCIDLDDTALYNYHKTTALQTAASGNRIILSVP